MLSSVGIACAPSPSVSEEASAADSAEAEAMRRARVGAPSGRPYSEERASCAGRNPLRDAYWGELHVHTALSFDSYLWGVRGTPDDAYRFAKGEPTGFPPYHVNGNPLRKARLERPLDFAAVTDHASYMGEVALCTRPGSPLYDFKGCRVYRGEIPVVAGPFGDFAAKMGAIASSIDANQEVPNRNAGLCGDGAKACRDSMRSVWQEVRASAERNYDRSSDCAFTTFHAYEYTATPGLSKVHHNVIFRNANVPETPVAWVDEPDVYGLWEKLRAGCSDAGTGCEVLTIPHNSNLSNGRMFAVTGRDLPLEEQRARALMRRDLEPLVEITQIKGDSECRDGMYQVRGAADEFCSYEEWRGPETEDCEEGTGTGALAGMGCVSRNDYVRHALVEGLREQRRIGVNPYRLGIIAATDAHNANPGDVEEYSYDGWRGIDDATAEQRLDSAADVAAAITNIASGPGGVAGVWAEENSRDSLFDAMQRRETFGTSGPRMIARFFGGWGYDASLCGDPYYVLRSYASGVPMGSELPKRPAGAGSPTFVVSAMRDPGIPEHPGGLLQRAQVIKGWVDDDGYFNESVYDVAGGANGASVDVDTCQPQGTGHDSLCGVWQDPDFDPEVNAVYYVRVLENPSCRWSQRQCVELGEDAPASCASPGVPRTLQERLWTSPIWYDEGA